MNNSRLQIFFDGINRIYRIFEKRLIIFILHPVNPVDPV